MDYKSLTFEKVNKKAIVTFNKAEGLNFEETMVLFDEVGGLTYDEVVLDIARIKNLDFDVIQWLSGLYDVRKKWAGDPKMTLYADPDHSETLENTYVSTNMPIFYGRIFKGKELDPEYRVTDPSDLDGFKSVDIMADHEHAD